MTLPPEKLGDKGQRYEVRYTASDGSINIFGWAGTEEGAEQLLDCVKAWPEATSGTIIDREASDENNSI